MLRRPQDTAGLSEHNKASRQRNMAKALTLRISLSLLLFLSVLASYQMGWIAPKGVPIATK
jgi:archaellum biogenesis protein FlaJ (TadC family)